MENDKLKKKVKDKVNENDLNEWYIFSFKTSGRKLR
jgi:uncharacterized protein YgiM (DUF1202 family)